MANHIVIPSPRWNTVARAVIIFVCLLTVVVSWELKAFFQIGGAIFGAIGLTALATFFLSRGLDYRVLLPAAITCAVLLSAGVGKSRMDIEVSRLDDRLQEVSDNLDAARANVRVFRTQIEKLYEYGVEKGQPFTIHQYLLTASQVREIRILGINGLGVVHGQRESLVRALAKDFAQVKILLLDPESQAFVNRASKEETYGKVSSGRLRAEWDASFSILVDIAHLLLHKFNLTPDEVAERLQVRLHNTSPDRSMLAVTTRTTKHLLVNRYPDDQTKPGTATASYLYNSGRQEYIDNSKYFEDLWNTAKTLELSSMRQRMNYVRLDDEEVELVYDRAVQLQRERRLEEASTLYDQVLSAVPPAAPTKELIELARRFLPRVYVTQAEPFNLKDIMVILHPDENLIAYHLVWEDDIDYLTDNDAGDHEVVWVSYDATTARIVKAWSYWHGEILTSDVAVRDANTNDGRVAVFVQWGKHGSLLKGWQTLFQSKGHEYEPLQYERLSEGRNEQAGYYASRWPTKFEGNEDDFTSFSKRIDIATILDRHGDQFIVVSKYANAVIDRSLIPYNIYPKTDWPDVRQ